MQDEEEQLTSVEALLHRHRVCLPLFTAPERITVLKSPNLVFFLWR